MTPLRRGQQPAPLRGLVSRRDVGFGARELRVAAQVAVCLNSTVGQRGVAFRANQDSKKRGAMADQVEHLFCVKRNGKVGYVDSRGNVAIEPRFDIAGKFSEGFAAISTEGGSGFINTSGAIVIEPTYDWVRGFSEGMAAVGITPPRKRWPVWGFIDATGEMVIEPKYVGAWTFSGGFTWVRVDSVRWRYIDRRDTTVLEMEAQTIGRFASGLATIQPRFKKNMGFIDKSGDMVIEPKFRAAEPFSEGLACVLARDKIGYIDVTGDFVIEPQFDRGGSFSENRAYVQKGGLTGPNPVGYIDRTGRVVIEPQFSHAGRFSGGRAAIGIREDPRDVGKDGYIDTDGNIVIEPQFRCAFPFTHGLAQVEVEDGRRGYVDRGGRYVWQPTK
jgi:hypothetical protein